MPSTENTATEKRDVYASVTAQIINTIEQGAGNWRMPWHTSGRFAFSPINVTSYKPYRGINTLCLWAAAQAKGYERGEWATYAQWQDKGAQVRKGEKAAQVVFWKFANSTSETDDGDSPHSGSRLLFTRGYSVFNAAQVDGYTPKAEADTPELERIAQAEAFFSNEGAVVRHGGNQAYYSPASDHIQMPPFLGKRFGDTAYAAEELIAELGAAFTCAHLGLSTEPRADHAAYIDSWLKVLRADKRAIFTAASKARQACDWLTARAESARVAEVAA